MTEEKNIKEKQKEKGAKKTLSLKTSVSPTQIRSNFSSSRANTVVVETKRKRVIRGPQKVIPTDKIENGELTNREINARNQAILDSKNSNLEVTKEDNEVIANSSKAEESNANNDITSDEILERSVPFPQEADAGRKNKKNIEGPEEQKLDELEEEVEEAKAPNKFTRFRPQEERRQTKITVTTALDDTPRQRSLASIRRRRERERRQHTTPMPTQKISREIR